MAASESIETLWHQMKQAGGDDWDRLRARKNKWVKKGLNEDEARQRAMGTIMANGQVIPINRDDDEEGTLETGLNFGEILQVVQVVACVIMLALTTGYQIYAQHALYGSEREGWYLAALMDLIMVGLMATAVRGWGLRLAKWVAVATIVLHMAATMGTASAVLTVQESPELKRLEQRYADTAALQNDIPKSRVSDRMKVSGELAVIAGEIKAERARITDGSFFGSTEVDVRTRVRWINIIAQLFFAHMLGLLIIKNVSRGTFSRLRRSMET